MNDPEQPDSAELAATEGRAVGRVAVDDGRHAHLMGLVLGWFGACLGSMQRP